MTPCSWVTRSGSAADPSECTIARFPVSLSSGLIATSAILHLLRRSRDLYAEAFERAPDDYYTGINAAAKSALAGSETDLQRAADYAARVQQRVGSAPVPGDYWKTATVGEVMLLQRRFAEAGELYAAGVAMAHKELGSHRSTWRQACRLMRVLEPSANEWALVRKAFAHLPDCDAL